MTGSRSRRRENLRSSLRRISRDSYCARWPVRTADEATPVPACAIQTAVMVQVGKAGPLVGEVSLLVRSMTARHGKMSLSNDKRG